MTDADERADQGAGRPASRVVAAVAWPSRKRRRLDPLADDRGEGEDRQGPDAAIGERAVDAAWSSPLMFAAVRRIQKSIQVTTPAARSIALPSKYCSAGELRPPMVSHRTTPTAAAEHDGRRRSRARSGRSGGAFPVRAR